MMRTRVRPLPNFDPFPGADAGLQGLAQAVQVVLDIGLGFQEFLGGQVAGIDDAALLDRDGDWLFSHLSLFIEWGDTGPGGGGR